MSLTTAAIEVLVAKGLSAADILDVSRALDMRADPTAAERKRRQRAREAEERDMSQRDVTRDENPAPDKSPQTPKINPTPRTGANAPAREATRLADDWKPATLSRETVSGEIIEHRGQEWAKRALESFRNHWRSANGPGARKRDWQATWANWVIEQDRRDGNRNGSGQRMGGNRGQGGSASGMGRTVDAAQRFLARRAEPAATSQ